MTMDPDILDRLAIRELIENWVVWRDAGDWERFATVWHDDGVMMAKDRIDPLEPGARPAIDAAALAAFPPGYRHLAYLQTRIGYDVERDMPQLTGPEVEALYARGKAWLSGGPAQG